MASGGAPSPQRRVLIVATGAPGDEEAIGAVRAGRAASEVEAVVVAPVVEESPAKRTAGELEEARGEAERRLTASLGRLREAGIAADGWVGDTDPILAAEDALRSFDAEEVLVFESAEGQARWLEGDLLERARELLGVPLRMASAADADGRGAATRPLAERAAGRGGRGSGREVGLGPYLPAFAGGDLAAVAVGILGTILAFVFFAAGPGPGSGAGAAQGLLAGVALLINLGHAIGLVLFESVGYRGGFQTFVRDVTLLYTPAAALANLVILLVA